MTTTAAAPAEGEPQLRCEALEVGYRNRALLPPIDLRIHRSDFWVVVGRNGAGKTTWFRTLLGLQSPVRGRIRRADGTHLSYIPQRTELDPLFPLLARDVVRLGAERDRSFLMPGLREPPEVAAALERLDLTGLAHRPFRSLSEGQKQRVLLARLAASSPDLALLDEPTAAMDMVAEREAFQFLDGLRRDRGTAVLVVSHYPAVARDFADHAIFVDRESDTVAVGTVDEVLAHPQYRRTYGGSADA